MSHSPVLCERRGTTLVITLHRPRARNAFDLGAMDALHAAVESAAHSDVRSVILTGHGTEAFCAGGDLKSFRSLLSAEDGRAMSLKMQRALAALEGLPVPVIGVLNGYAMGGGCEAFLATDLRVAEQHASMSFRQLAFGVSLGWGGTARLVRDVGARRAQRMVLMQESLNADALNAEGLVDVVVPSGKGMDQAMAWAEKLAGLAPLAVRAVKRMVAAASPALMQFEANEFARTWGSEDHHEAVAAFFEQRPPRFEGR